MSMLNIDGQLVASALLNQQSGDVFNGILQHRREMRAAEMQQQQQFADQQHYARLVAKYNNLADRFNEVLAENKRIDSAYADAIAEINRRIARLTAENAQLVEEKEETRKSAYEGWTKHGDALIEIERLKIKAGESQPPELKPITDF
jgi:uncharacterized protein YdcH (DUF465 family)